MFHHTSCSQSKSWSMTQLSRCSIQQHRAMTVQGGADIRLHYQIYINPVRQTPLHSLQFFTKVPVEKIFNFVCNSKITPLCSPFSDHELENFLSCIWVPKIFCNLWQCVEVNSQQCAPTCFNPKERSSTCIDQEATWISELVEVTKPNRKTSFSECNWTSFLQSASSEPSHNATYFN